MRKRTLAARRTSLRLALALLTCLGALHSGHGQAFTIPGLSDIPALPGLATGLVNSITSGTKPGSVKPVGSTGLAVVSVNPYGCNAPAVPLQSWNIDLTQVYVLRGIALNALTIPSQGVNIEVRAAKTTAELSTWSGNNPLCAAFLLTIDNLSKVINCTQPMAARYMTIVDVDGDTLPVCAMDALVVNPVPPPFPPAAAPAPPPTAGASSVWFPSLAPRGAQQALAPAPSQASAAGAPQADTFPQLTPPDQSQSRSQPAWSSPNGQTGMSQLGGSAQQWRPANSLGGGGGGGGGNEAPAVPAAPAQSGGGTLPGGGASMRPLSPAEAQSSSSLSSTISQEPSGGRSSLVLTNEAVIGIAAAAFVVISAVIGGITFYIIKKEESEELVMGKKVPF
ncbi:g6705 [Coccomyxa elongata]